LVLQWHKFVVVVCFTDSVISHNRLLWIVAQAIDWMTYATYLLS
jgi:hypothetical protein